MLSDTEVKRLNRPILCRFCRSEVRQTFVDLGMSPLCENYLQSWQLGEMEPFYPLHVYVCERCFLVQLEEFVTPDSIFTEYAYFSSFSDSWLDHCRQYAAQMVDRCQLSDHSFVVELGSNDGYLLQYFVRMGIPSLGIEPAANVAKVAAKKQVSTLVRFFGRQLAIDLTAEGKQADLLIGNNVLAQVPNLCDFVAGMKIILKPQGVLTVEFPHLLRLIEGNQFDTIYHEHFSYFSLLTATRIFGAHGLVLFDVEEVSTHGGSLRVFGRHFEDARKPVTTRVSELIAREEAAGLNAPECYHSFSEKVKKAKRALLSCLMHAKEEGKSIVGYGAPGKGNTLLNYCGVGKDLLDYTVDRNPYKQGRFTPGMHIPIYHPDKIVDTRPDYLLILPWNLRQEIMQQLSFVRGWGGKFIIPIPVASIYA